MATELPRLIVFASGSKDGGGSGFERLVQAAQEGVLQAEIVAVVSNYESGGVRQRADRLGVPFEYFPSPWVAEEYQRIVRDWNAGFTSLSGWLKQVMGLDPKTTFNIHPGPLPKFGGPGMYGHHVHEAVLAAYKAWEVKASAVSMHFVIDDPDPQKAYDRGPVFFQIPVPIESGDTADSLGKRVNAEEHRWQPIITNLVVSGRISWDGRNPTSLVVPRGYRTVQLPEQPKDYLP